MPGIHSFTFISCYSYLTKHTKRENNRVMNNKSHRTIESQTMVVTDYHKGGTIENVQKEGTMEFPTRWLCYTGKRSCESRSCDRIST